MSVTSEAHITNKHMQAQDGIPQEHWTWRIIAPNLWKQQ